MSEQIYCPDCGHPFDAHREERAIRNIPSSWRCDVEACPCTRTYESLIAGNTFKNEYAMDNEPELSLLVIDLGDSCVVKVEKGEVALKIGNGLWLCNTEQAKATQVFYRDFQTVREAIEQKPVPRIERHYDDPEDFALVQSHRTNRIDGQMYKVLSALNGKPLPIWKGGEWEDLLPKKGLGWELPLGIWRYTR